MSDISIRGPLFDGSAEAAARQMADAIAEAIAKEAFATVHLFMDQTFRNPTPYYETQVVLDRQGDDRVIHDRGIVYGPWLEGISSRNQTTRFKGYRNFRRATQQTEAKAEKIAEQVARRYVPRMS